MLTAGRIDDLFHAYAEGPDLLESAVADVSEEERRFKPGPEHWSIHENVVHVAETDLIAAARIRYVWGEPGTMLIGFDDPHWARVMDYSGQSFEASLALLRALRASTADLLRRARAEVWEQSGMHTELGTDGRGDRRVLHQPHPVSSAHHCHAPPAVRGGAAGGHRLSGAGLESTRSFPPWIASRLCSSS